jgi:hypothetical protein
MRAIPGPCRGGPLNADVNTRGGILGNLDWQELAALRHAIMAWLFGSRGRHGGALRGERNAVPSLPRS